VLSDAWWFLFCRHAPIAIESSTEWVSIHGAKACVFSSRTTCTPTSRLNRVTATPSCTTSCTSTASVRRAPASQLHRQVIDKSLHSGYQQELQPVLQLLVGGFWVFFASKGWTFGLIFPKFGTGIPSYACQILRTSFKFGKLWVQGFIWGWISVRRSKRWSLRLPDIPPNPQTHIGRHNSTSSCRKNAIVRCHLRLIVNAKSIDYSDSC